MSRLRLLLVASAFALAPLARAAEPAPANERVDELVRQLASGSFRQREAAVRELDRIGEPALPALRAALVGPEAEARRRASGLLEKIGRRVESARLLAATEVELKLDAVPLSEAVAQLVKQGRTPVELRGDPALARRKVTLDTGKVPFWEALDRLCEAADLVEADALGAPGGPPGGPVPAFEGPVPVNYYPGHPGAVGPLPPLVLTEGKYTPIPTVVFGGVRLRLAGSPVASATPPVAPPGLPVPGVPVGGPVGHNPQYQIPVSVRPESSLVWQGIRAVQVDLAIDDNGQSLSGVAQGSADFGNPLMEQRLALRGRALRPAYGYFPGVMFEPFRAFLQVERGPKASKKLADLRGKLVVAVQVPPEELAVVSDLKEPKGEQVKGEKGVDLRVTRCKTVGNNVEVDAELRYPHQEVQPAGTAPAVPGEPAVNRFMGLALFDEKGKEYTFQYCRQQEVSQNGTTMTFKVQMNYTRTRKDQPAPARMAFLATRTATADIPFSFKDVPLP